MKVKREVTSSHGSKLLPMSNFHVNVDAAEVM